MGHRPRDRLGTTNASAIEHDSPRRGSPRGVDGPSPSGHGPAQGQDSPPGQAGGRGRGWVRRLFAPTSDRAALDEHEQQEQGTGQPEAAALLGSWGRLCSCLARFTVVSINPSAPLAVARSESTCGTRASAGTPVLGGRSPSQEFSSRADTTSNRAASRLAGPSSWSTPRVAQHQRLAVSPGCDHLLVEHGAAPRRPVPRLRGQ